MEKGKKKMSAEEMQEDDPCLFCGGPSGQKKGTPIDQRLYHVKDAGQLCKKCYKAAFDQT